MIVKIIYGYIAEAHQKNPLIEMASEAMENFTQAAVPGAFLVDIMPLCE